jgi:hypothetical protein
MVLKQETKYIWIYITPMQYKTRMKIVKPMGLISSKYVIQKHIWKKL